MMHFFSQDLRYALRQLRRSPGFAITAVLTLALGVGANSAIFSLLDQALLRSLPVRDPQQLVILEGTGKAWQGNFSSHGGDDETYFSYPMYRDLRDRSSAFEGLVATTSTSLGLSWHGTPSVVDAELVSGNYFQVLGTEPLLGRLFNGADDDVAGNHQVAVLSYGYWKDKLGGDTAVLGETIRLNGQPTQVIGVAAPSFQSAVWGQTPAVFVPMAMESQLAPERPKWNTDRRDRWLNIIGRLRHGETMTQAEAQLAPLWHALRADEIRAMGTRSPRFVNNYLTTSTLRVLPGARGLSYRREGLQTPLLVVMGMAFLVLLIAAVNVASLLLVRSSGRVREFAVRYALGATARRVIAQLLLEGLLIGLLGALAGLLLAPTAMHTIASRLVNPGDTDYLQATVNTRLLLFSFATAIIVSVSFSAAPALQLLRPDMVNQLKQQVGTAGGARIGYRRLVVSLQIGLSVLLLVGTGLFVQTLRNVRSADVGFNTGHLLTFSMDPQLAGISPDRIPALQERALERMESLPGVTAVGATDNGELTDSNSMTNVTVRGYAQGADEDTNVLSQTISTNYLPTLQVPIVAGRNFTSSDDRTHAHVAIVNESFARRFLVSPTAAIGKSMARGGGNNLEWMQIVGVTRDVHHATLRDAPRPSFFVPLKQNPPLGATTMYLRTVSPPLATAASVRSAMHEIEPGVALTGLQGMDQQIESDLINERMIGLLAIAFSALATALAGIGLYGVLAFSVTQRTREIGIRMALGSTRGMVARLVVADVLGLAGVGIAVALPFALLAARSVRSQLYGVSAADPRSVLFAILLITLVCLIAALVPARRAATVHPNTALRME